MITRFVFIRLSPDHATDDGRAAVVAQARALAALVDRLELSVPADDSAVKWDVALVASAANLAALATAQASPAWRALDELLAARAIVVKAWNFAAA